MWTFFQHPKRNSLGRRTYSFWPSNLKKSLILLKEIFSLKELFVPQYVSKRSWYGNTSGNSLEINWFIFSWNQNYFFTLFRSGFRSFFPGGDEGSDLSRLCFRSVSSLGEILRSPFLFLDESEIMGNHLLIILHCSR